MAVKIFTMTHKKFPEPEDTIYIPLHVGRRGSQDLGYQGDDTGDSISGKNKFYGELTGVYWVWKNCHEADYVGICHYRRFFLNSQRRLLSQQELEEILQSHDIIVSKMMQTEGCYLDYYGEAHNAQDLLTAGEVIKERYPKDYPFFESAMAGSQYYYGNLMVTSKENFNAYAEWLFTILFETEKRIDVSGYDLYNQRVFGFLSEQLLKVWIDANGLKVYEGTVGVTAEKAETVEFKLAMAQLVKQGDTEQASELFYGYLKLRPDIRLELSDIKGEIPIIEQLLYMCGQEKERGFNGLLGYSKDLNQLIRHYRRLCDILKRMSGPEQNPETIHQDMDYVTKTGVSWIQIEVILLNAPEEFHIDAVRVKQKLSMLYD